MTNIKMIESIIDKNNLMHFDINKFANLKV